MTIAEVGPRVGADIGWICWAQAGTPPTRCRGRLLVGGVPAPLMAAGLILAASPMLTVYAIFGQRFGLGTPTAAALA